MIAGIAAPIYPDLPREQFNDPLKKSDAKVLRSPCFPDVDDNELDTKCLEAATGLDLLSWHIHRIINEHVVLKTQGRIIGSGAAWSGVAADSICIG